VEQEASTHAATNAGKALAARSTNLPRITRPIKLCPRRCRSSVIHKG
jgi:hypothetical protein